MSNKKTIDYNFQLQKLIKHKVLSKCPRVYKECSSFSPKKITLHREIPWLTMYEITYEKITE